MGVKLYGPGEAMDLDLGKLGYSERLIVHDYKAWWVYFSTHPNGTGNVSIQEMAEEDASKYPVGGKVLFHYRRNEPAAAWMPPGWGELIAISVAS